MSINSHPYHNENDLGSIQSATAEWIAAAGFRGYLNISDIALRLFNGMRRYNPSEIVRLWEDSDGRVIGWGMTYPAWNSYEALLHPHYRSGQLAMDILNWAEGETLDWMRKSGQNDQPLQLDVFEGDTARTALLEQRGYVGNKQRDLVSTRSLDEPIPQPQLPNGFSIRSVHGEREADKLVALINNSFGWHWTVDGYSEWMRSPGYRADNESVIVAPDGRFVASCILLPDAYNRTAMFENVGTHSDFRRLGLGKALLYAGMRHMKAQGFTLAMIPHAVELGAAANLYASVGFQPTYKVFHYRLSFG